MLRYLEDPDEYTGDAAAVEQRYLDARQAVEESEHRLDEAVNSSKLLGSLGLERFEKLIETLQAELDQARRTLWETPNPGVPDDANIVYLGDRPVVYQLWDEMTLAEKRAHMRRYVAGVTLRRADPAHRKHQPIAERVEIRWVGQDA